MTLVIVGASLAGLRAVEAARKSGYSGAITLIGAERHLPYNRPPLSKEFLSAGSALADQPDPAFRSEAALRGELGAELKLGRRAVALETGRRAVRLHDGEMEPYSALVIATGAEPRALPGTPGPGTVRTLRTLDDARHVRKALDAGARTVVVGAGFIGSEVASAARQRGLPVTVVEASAVPLTRSVGPSLGLLLADLHKRAGTDLRLGAAVDRAENGHVMLRGGERIRADLVVAGIGAVPCTDWLAGSGVELDPRDGGVLCDETLTTSVPGVYAAGDVCSWASGLAGRRLRLEHWTSAAEQGSVAGHNAAAYLAGATSGAGGGARVFDTVPYFWSDWYGSRIQFVGEPSGADTEVIGGGWDDGKLLVLYRRGDRLAGALTVNRPGLIMKLRRLTARRESWESAAALAAAAL